VYLIVRKRCHNHLNEMHSINRVRRLLERVLVIHRCEMRDQASMDSFKEIV
jgi:hypothetical protein